MARGRIPDPIKSTKISIGGRRKRGVSTRDDKTFAWLDSIPPGKRFEFTWELLTAALNGELGPVMQEAAEESDLEKAKRAAERIKSAFVLEDD